MLKSALATLRTLLSRSAVTVCLLAACPSAAYAEEKPSVPSQWSTARICDAISRAAKQYKLPRAAFARLIWTESRFDIKAISPVGAEGIAQFMPGTAKERGLEDPYDPAQALPASASLLASLRSAFGNFGLAAAAYNAGPGRVERWLAGTSGLPFETIDYVAAVTGREAASFRVRTALLQDRPLQKGKHFDEACRALPILKTRFRGADQPPRQPWGVQVAGNFSRARAMRSWTRVRAKIGVQIGESKPRLYRDRALRGMRRKWAVRLGTPTRKQAITLCKRIRNVGGFCLVKKN